jgi:signal transduction histidine kinase
MQRRIWASPPALRLSDVNAGHPGPAPACARRRFGWLSNLLAVAVAGSGFGGVESNAAETNSKAAVISLVAAGYSATHWTVEDGLPMQNVTSLAQTADGFLWCGTFDGLARFDGLDFKVFFPYEVPELEGFQIVELHSDHQGRLWIIDANGKLAVRDNGQFRHCDERLGLPQSQAGGLRLDEQGQVWLRGLSDGRFYRLNANRFEGVTHPSLHSSAIDEFRTDSQGLCWGIRSSDRKIIHFTPSGYEEQEVLARDGSAQSFGRFFDLQDGTLAATSPQGIYVLEGGRWALRHQFDSPITESAPLDGCRDANGNYWIGTAGGGLVLSLNDGHTGRIALPGEGAHPTVRSLMLDSEGNIWAGGTAGLYRIRRNPVRSWTVLNGLPPGAVRSLARDGDQRIWFAQENRIGWLATKTNAAPVVAYERAKLNAWRVAPARDGSVWVAIGLHGGKRCEVRRWTVKESQSVGQLESGTVEDMYETKSGELWVSSGHGLFHRKGSGFSRVKVPAEVEGRPINALVEDRGGRTYVAVFGVGLYRIENDLWQRLTQRTDQGSDRIQALHLDGDGTLWIGADRPGLARWKDEVWFGFTGLEGELPRKVLAVAADDRGALWLTSRWGLVRASRRALNERASQGTNTLNTTWLDREDGLASIECTRSQSGICKDSRGQIWVATARGLSVIDPVQWEKRRGTHAPPPVHIEGVSVDDAPVTPMISEKKRDAGLRRVEVAAGSQRIDIRYTAIDLTAPEKVRFRQRLEGFDDKWVNATGPRSVHFTRLPPGEYRFHVIAANNDGIWNRVGASLVLSVQPAWWQWTSMRIGAGVLLIGLIGWAVQVRISRLQRQRAMQVEFSRQLIRSQEQERKRIAGELHDSLGQNLLVARNLALTGVNVSSGNAETAERFGEISDAVAAALREARSLSKALRPLELDHLGLTKALGGMAQRISESLGIECHIKMDDIDGLLPAEEEINLYRLVQEGMNNVAKHSQANRVKLQVLHEPDHLDIQIVDNGRGFDVVKIRAAESGPTGTGLTGMEERARLAGGDFEIKSEPGHGTVVKIRIPVKAPRT